MNYQEEQEEKNTVVLFINVELVGVEREVTFAIYSNTARLFTIGSLFDNQYYAYLESLLIQTNPKQEESVFQVHVILPQLKSERKKLLQKLSDYPTKIREQKLGKGEVELALTFLLKKSYNMYNKQLQLQKQRIVLQKLLQVISIQRDNSNKSQFNLKRLNPRATMTLDKSTINAIQIFSKQTQKKIHASNTTLYEILNKCKTSFGTRCLKRWMKQPLQDVNELQMRLDKIQYFIGNVGLKNTIQNELKKLPDLDRLYFVFYKVATGKKMRCDVSDLIKIYRVVQSLNLLVTNMESKDLSDKIIQPIYEDLRRNVSIINKISKMIEKGIDMSGPRDNEFYVRPETQPSLEGIMKEMKDIEKSINDEVKKVQKVLNLEVQKISSNVHRYVLEASKKQAINTVKQTPGYKFLTAKQTKITFITENLSRLCERLKVVEEEYKNQQQVLLKRMFELVAGYYPVMEELSFMLSELDVLTTLASVVNTSNGMWCRPTFSEGLSGKGMRHPCIKNCVPNNCSLKSHKTIILTGPNMGGKSTYIRTIGVCAYLAHIGCYVPAVEFQTPIIDAIITRVGASDLQLKGISTFMSEMLQSSCMIETATSKSLVLIDELGRGTSTCEGFGIAWAICQYLHKTINPFCLFATHFHQMTRMADEVEGVKNMFTCCQVQNGQLKLQYKVQQGKMEKSYGIQVMKILKFPGEVIQMAQNYLQYYECNQQQDGEMDKYSEEVKQQIYRLSDQMEEQLSRCPPTEHASKRQAYRLKFQQLLSR